MHSMKQGLPARTEGLASCWQYEGKRWCLFFFNTGSWYCAGWDKIADSCPFPEISIPSICSGFERSLRRENYPIKKTVPSLKPGKPHGSSECCLQGTVIPCGQYFHLLGWHFPWELAGSYVASGDKSQLWSASPEKAPLLSTGWGHEWYLLPTCWSLPTPPPPLIPPKLTLRFLLDFGKPFSAGGSALLPWGRLAAWFAPALMASGSSGKRSGILDKRAKSMLTHSDFTSSLSFRGDRSSFLPKGTRV